MTPLPPATDPERFSAETSSRLKDAFDRHESRFEDGATLSAALDAMCTEARFRRMPAAAVVIAMRNTWQSVPRPHSITEDGWAHVYHVALGKCFVACFGNEP